MAKVSTTLPSRLKNAGRRTIAPPHLTTSIGASTNTRVKNKGKRRMTKPYRGQGR